MSALADYPVTRKWPPRHPEQLQLYSLPTPNGVKVSVMLEETGLAYEPHLVNFDTNDQLSPEFRSLNPYGKIPAILDPNGPEGRPLALFESGAILIYLADKSGQFLPREAGARYQTIQWLMFQMGGIGPMFGQVGFFHKFAGKDFEDKRPRDRYVTEARRLLGVLNERLDGAHLAHGRRLHHRRHGRLPLGAQPRGLLWSGGAGALQRVPARGGNARTFRGASGSGTCALDTQARLISRWRPRARAWRPPGAVVRVTARDGTRRLPRGAGRGRQSRAGVRGPTRRPRPL